MDPRNLSVVSKIFEKHVSNRLVDHLGKEELFMVSGLSILLQILSEQWCIKVLGLETFQKLLKFWKFI